MVVHFRDDIVNQTRLELRTHHGGGQEPINYGEIQHVIELARQSGLPAHRVPHHGVAYVPQGRRLFGPLTVAENLSVGLYARDGGPEVRAAVLELFPRLRERLGQVSSTLSGGEQQMLAIARALCLEPKVLMLDEPTEGLQPSMIRLIQDTVLRLKDTGVATILVEQRVDAALRVADGIAFMANGRIAEAVDVIRNEWRRAAAEGVTAEEVADAKTYLTGAYPLRFDGNGPIANIMVGMQMMGLPIDYIATRNDRVEAVTVEDVKRVAGELLDPENLHFVVVGEPEGLEDMPAN